MDLEEEHPNVILHIDFDCYYAQIEQVMNPQLKGKPFGVKQRFHVVTTNYIARSLGITKMMLISDALKICPSLVLINGEDLTNYKTYAKRITELVHLHFGPSEKLGMDEHYLDVTKVINKQISELNREQLRNVQIVGPLHPCEQAFSECHCGCELRLKQGSQLAQTIRHKIFQELRLTCSVGIAHNKLLAKLVGQQNKPDNQTTLAPSAAASFMAELKNLRRITGIGDRTAAKIEELNIRTVSDLQTCDDSVLEQSLGFDAAQRLKQLSLGNDPSEVKPSGKQKSVGLEDSCLPISLRSEATEKFRALLTRLVMQIQDDMRIPSALKVTVRKYDPQKKNSIRETKQCTVAATLFRIVKGRVQLVDSAEEKLLKNIMVLFDRMVDLKQQLNITLLGLCFSKFQDHQRGPSSIANFLIKKQDVEVQSITNLSNESININNNNNSYGESFRSTSSPSSMMDYDSISNTSLDLSGSEESELEPSPKKRKKLNVFLVTGRSRRHSSNDDLNSPSKLNVSNLRLNGNAMDTTTDGVMIKSSATSSSSPRIISPLCIPNNQPTAAACSSSSELPPNIDPNVWKELPLEVQRELVLSWQIPTLSTSAAAPPPAPPKKTSNATLHKYFIRN